MSSSNIGPPSTPFEGLHCCTRAGRSDKDAQHRRQAQNITLALLRLFWGCLYSGISFRHFYRALESLMSLPNRLNPAPLTGLLCMPLCFFLCLCLYLFFYFIHLCSVKSVIALRQQSSKLGSTLREGLRWRRLSFALRCNAQAGLEV